MSSLLEAEVLHTILEHWNTRINITKIEEKKKKQLIDKNKTKQTTTTTTTTTRCVTIYMEKIRGTNC